MSIFDARAQAVLYMLQRAAGHFGWVCEWALGRDDRGYIFMARSEDGGSAYRPESDEVVLLFHPAMAGQIVHDMKVSYDLLA